MNRATMKAFYLFLIALNTAFAVQLKPVGSSVSNGSLLIQKLGDKNRRNRIEAVSKITQDSSLISDLLNALNHKNKLIRIYSAIALTHYIDNDSLNAVAGLDVLLSELITDYSKKNWETKVDIVNALARLGHNAKRAEGAISAAVSESGREFILYIQDHPSITISDDEWGDENDLPPYPFILTRFNKDGTDAIEIIRKENKQDIKEDSTIVK